MDRRTKTERRKSTERRNRVAPVDKERRNVGERREKVQRRRQIDPTTCERDYTNDEIEFMQAMDEYKRRSGRMFPTCSEILEVIRDMGYVKHHGGMIIAANISADSHELEADALADDDIVAATAE